MISRPLALMGFSLSLSLLALSLFDGCALVLAPAACCALLMCFALKPLKNRGACAVSALCVLLGCLVFQCSEEYRYKPCVALAGEKSVVRAELVSNPSYNDARWSAVVKVISIDGVAADCRMSVRSDDFIDARPYDVLEFTAPVFSTEDIDPEIRNYYKSKNIFLVCYCMEGLSVTTSQSRNPGRFFLKANAYLCRRLNAVLSGEEGALAIGILTGNKSYISDRTKNNFANSGLSHVLAVSGLHMSILIMSLYSFLRVRLGRFRKAAAAVSMVAAVVYAGVTGFSPSALRACIMLCVMMLGKLISKRADTLNSMGLAALLIALVNPYSVADWSFLLSFSATLGIVLLSRPIHNRAQVICYAIKQPYLFKSAVSLIDSAGISVAATVFCLPVSVFFIGSVSTVFLPANLLTAFSVPAVLLTALASAAPLGVVSKAAAFLCEAFSAFILKITDALSELEYSTLSTDGAIVKGSLAAAMLVILLGTLLIKQKKRLIKFGAVVIGATLLLNVALGTAMGYKRVNIAVGENCVIVYSGSTAVVAACGYYGCYQAEGFLDDLGIRAVTLILPDLKSESSIYEPQELFENRKVERLILCEDHSIKQLSESYEIADNAQLEFNGITVSFCADYLLADSAAGSTLVAFNSGIPEIKTDFAVFTKEIPVWVGAKSFTAFVSSADTLCAFAGAEITYYDSFVLLDYNGFGRYNIKGGQNEWQF